MTHIPLFFRFEEDIPGPGFVARVRFLGRVTCTREFGSTWMYGVNPGAIAEEGDGIRAAYVNFRASLTEIFLDLAEESSDIGEFRADARSFFDATDETSVREWESARQAVRAGEEPGLDPGLTLDRETGGTDADFQVTTSSGPATSQEVRSTSEREPRALLAA